MRNATVRGYTRRCETAENIHEVIGNPCPRQCNASRPTTKASNNSHFLSYLFFWSSFSLPKSVIFIVVTFLEILRKKCIQRGFMITILQGQHRIPSAQQRALVSHTFVFVYMREFGYYILFGASRNEEKSL